MGGHELAEGDVEGSRDVNERLHARVAQPSLQVRQRRGADAGPRRQLAKREAGTLAQPAHVLADDRDDTWIAAGTVLYTGRIVRHNEQSSRGAIRRQALSIAFAVVPFGIAFGVTAARARLALWQTSGFSLFVFAGSAQFAAVEIVGRGGAVASAVGAGLLLNLRSLGFGGAIAPSLPGPRGKR